MKKRIAALLLSVAMVATMIPVNMVSAAPGEEDLGTNVAPQATASAGYTNVYGVSTTAMNDGQLAGSNPSTSWNCWGASDNAYPMNATLTWEDNAYRLTGMRVMWWAYSDGGVVFPSECTVEYWDMNENQYKTIGAVGVECDTSVNNGADGNNAVWNYVEFEEPILTNSLQLKISRNAESPKGVGISEWEAFGTPVTAEDNILVGAAISGEESLAKNVQATYTAATVPEGLTQDITYQWEVVSGEDKIAINGSSTESTVTVDAKASGSAILKVTISHIEDGNTVTKTAEQEIKVEGIEGVETYKTATAEGVAPILPNRVVVKGLTFDDPTPSLMTRNNEVDLGETFDSKLVPVTWEEVNPEDYAVGKKGTTFTVSGKVEVGVTEYPATAEITVNDKVVTPVANTTVTFENVQLTDNFWNPKQKINAVTSLNKAISEIEKSSGGEPNFKNAVKKLNGEDYNAFSGFVFQDSDIYKSIEAISYTLSVINDDADMADQKAHLEEKLAEWIDLIEQVQYADGYIDTFFTLRSTSYSGGGSPGTHRWRNFSNHEMYCAGHFFEAVDAYTRYREGIGDPDYSLYVAGKRFADEIVSLFGPDGTRHEVPGHEEVELGLVKMAKLIEEHEGEGTGDKYVEMAQIFIDRRGESSSLRDSGYFGGTYSQDRTAFANETSAVGHSVRAMYYYTGATDVAALLPDDNETKQTYMNTLSTIWDAVENRKTYITGGIGTTAPSSDSEGFGDDYVLPNDQSYCEICAAIGSANWNQRMNLLYEDAKYADVVERNLYNSILVGTNLDGNRFYYSTLLEVESGNARSEWFSCACCPPNLMRTIAKLSEYMYTVHGDKLYVNQYIGSDGSVNVDGTEVAITQETNYPWEGSVKMTVEPAADKAFAMKIRIPGWIDEQENKTVTIKVNGTEVTGEKENGYVTVDRTWTKGDVVTIEMPMEVRKTEADPNVTTNEGRIALERGPIVYCMEKAGNAQLNEDIEEFSPLNFVIPRASELKAEYQEDLLNGVVEITGDVMYDDGSANGKLAKLQAVPYYAWNNRGDNGVQGQNRSSQMLIWTEATDEEISDLMITGGMPITPGESTTLTAELTSGEAQSYQWEIVSGDSLWIVKDEDAATVTIKGLAVGKTILKVTVTTADGKTLTKETEFEVEEKKDPSENNVAPKASPVASFVNPYLDRNTAPQKVIDGELADGPSMTWNTYAMSGDTATITLTWDKEYDLYGMRVMWWSDNGGVKFPQSCKAEYYDAEADSWVELTDMTDETGAAITSVGVKFGTEKTAASSERNYTNGNNRYWNVATFTEPIKTSRLRLTPTRNGSGSTGFGIGEWEVFGEVSKTVGEDNRTLVASYDMTAEDGKLVDTTGNRNDAAYVGFTDADFQTEGEDAVLVFGGDKGKYVTLPAGLIKTESFAIEATFKTSTVENSWIWCLGTKENSWPNVTNYVFVSPRFEGDILRAGIKDESAEKLFENAGSIGEDYVTVRMEFDNGSMRLLVDGVEVSTMETPYRIQDILAAGTEGDICGYIGKSLYTADKAFTGTLTQFDVYVEKEPATLESITVTPPTKTEYTVGEDLELAGMKVTANYSDDTTEDVVIANCEVSGYDKTKVGEQTITVKYEEKTDTFIVTVAADKTALKAAIDGAIDVSEADKYESISWAAYQTALDAAKLVYNNPDATQADVDAALTALTEATNNLVLKPVETRKLVASYDMTVADGKLVDKSGNSNDAKYVGFTEADFQTEGEGDNADAVLVFDGSTKYVELPAGLIETESFAIEATFKTSTVANSWLWCLGTVDNTNYVFVSPRFSGNVIRAGIKTTAGNERLFDNAGTLTDEYATVRMEYDNGEMKLLVNGEEKSTFTTAHSVQDILKNGTADGICGYIGKSLYAADPYFTGTLTEFKVYAEEAEPATLESITVTAPTKTEYTVGEDLDLAGMKVTANYSDDTTEDVAIEDCEVSGYDKTKAGEQTVTVTYGGKTATFKVTVKEAAKPEIPEVLADFNFDAAPAEGEAFDGGNAKASGTYTLVDHGTGKALKLDGTSQFLNVTAKDGTSLLTGVEEMTVSFQINPGQSATNWGFFAAANVNEQLYKSEKYLGIYDENGTVKAQRFNSNAQDRPASPEYAAGENKWSYITVVYAENETILYVNGVEAGREESIVSIPELLGDSSILYIGKSTWKSGEYMTGLIDNYKIV
ncbi:MAG: beta-L-arabinofuranosidase domain-containing protein, partial [Dorea sp.]